MVSPVNSISVENGITGISGKRAIMGIMDTMSAVDPNRNGRAVRLAIRANGARSCFEMFVPSSIRTFV